MASVTQLQEDFQYLSVDDDQPLTAGVMDDVSKLLRDDWKNLARKIGIEESDIEQIDLDFRTVYEKSYEMLKKWTRNSKISVTIGMIKRFLMSICRNDILLDVFQGGNAAPVARNLQERPEQPLSSRETKSSNVNTNSTRNGSRDAIISNLTMLQKRKLADYLDADHGTGIRNWLHLGLALVKSNKELIHKIESLPLHYAGGGSPAMTFLSTLAVNQPEVTVEEFRKTAKDLERNDVVLYINKNLQHQYREQIRSISYDHKEHIANKLDKQIPGICDWKFFAEEYGYSSQQILGFQTSIKHQNSYSPTMKMLEIVSQWNPKLPLKDISKECQKLQRNDVALYLDNIK